MKPNYRLMGILVTIGGFVLSTVGDWIASKELDEMIDEKVNEALANREEA